jgi:DNA-directed RNA polymerase specialized sigma24 family protein
MPPKPARAAKVMRTGPAGEPTMAELVETLPRSQRAVMRLVLAGASAEEISDELGRSRASVMRDMHRARERLRELRAAPGRIG